VVVEAALIALAWFSCLLEIVSFVRVWRFLPTAWKAAGLPRIAMFGWASLKAWVVLFLFLSLVLAPAIARGYVGARIVPYLNLFLILYLIVQPVAVNVAIWRWDRKRRREAHGAG
jgi:hypothetical protein